MSKQTEHSQTTHPSAAELDRLRAGLLEATSAERAAVLAHLEDCSECRAHAALWPRLVTALGEAALDRASTNALRARRRLALQGIGTRDARRRPIALALAAAVAAVAIGIGTLFLGPSRNSPPSLAGTEAPAADLYVDLDFYLWLLHKQAHEGASPNS